MRRPVIHVIGAGLSGLTAALRLSEAGRFDVVLHERRAEPGGRRRALYDSADLCWFDSFPALVLPHWRATRALIRAVGAADEWSPGAREIAFVDMARAQRWTSAPGAGRRMWWALSPKRRAPGLTFADYLGVARFVGAPLKIKPPHQGLAAERLWRPLALAALNRDLVGAAPALFAATLDEALSAPAHAPLFPLRDFRHGLLLPLTQQLTRRGVVLRFERSLQALQFVRDRVAALEFEHDSITLEPRDGVVLATPPWIAAPLLPGLLTPDEFSATITAHFEAPPPEETPHLTLVLNGPVFAILRRPEGLTVSVRDAERDLEAPRAELAAKYWAAVAAITGLSDALPAWRVIPQRRATFAATPAQNALRPEPVTPWRNLTLAGAYVRNELPESLESAVRSGERAAEVLAEAM